MIPSWLKQTIKAFSSVKDGEPVTAELTCYCGLILEHERKKMAQLFQCRECGERLFLFPLNVYPEPKQTTSSKKPLKSNPEKKPNKQIHSPKPIIKPKKETETTEISQQETEAVAELRTLSETDSLAVPHQKWFTPFRLILICIGFVLLLTGGWLFHSYRQEWAIETLRTSVEAGELAITEENFVSAEEEFEKAVNAIIILKKENVKSRQVQQLHKELHAINHLSSRSFFELIADAEVKYDQATPENWKSYFQSYYADHWVIIEANITREEELPYSLLIDQQIEQQKKKTTEKELSEEDSDTETEIPDEETPDHQSTPHRYVVNYPLEINAVPVVLHIDLSEMKRLPFTNPTETFLFAGKLRRCQLLNSYEPVWVIDFVPGEMFLWSNDHLLSYIGYPTINSEEKMRRQKILSRQSKLLSLKE